jgi:hypothetical protein
MKTSSAKRKNFLTSGIFVSNLAPPKINKNGCLGRKT